MLKVMTYNIHSAIGTDGLLDIDRICDVIKQSGANIVGLNEVDCRFHKRSLFRDQPAEIAERLEMHYSFAPGITLSSLFRKPGGFGNVLLSQYPIVEAKTIPLVGWTSGEEPRALLKAVVETDESLIDVGVTHLGLKEQSRINQVNSIISTFTLEKPTIIMGDWNAKPGEQAYQSMTEHFQDVWEVNGEIEGYTFSSTAPKARIDYIFISKHYRAIDAKVWTEANGASDHFPLVCSLSETEVLPSAIKINFHSRF